MERVLVKKIKDEYREYLVFFELGNFKTPLFILNDFEAKNLIKDIQKEIKIVL